MQRPMSRKEWAERLLQDPTLGMDPNNIDLSAFSERVTELFVRGAGTVELMKSGNEWLPEIVLHGNAEIPCGCGSRRRRACRTESLVEEAERGGDRVLEVEGVFVSLREARNWWRCVSVGFRKSRCKREWNLGAHCRRDTRRIWICPSRFNLVSWTWRRPSPHERHSAEATSARRGRVDAERVRERLGTGVACR